MRSPRKVYQERIRGRGDDSGRYIDMTARVRVYRRTRRTPTTRSISDEEILGPSPAEYLPEVYGGIWDTWSRQYLKHGDHPFEFRIHPGQVRLLESFDMPHVKRTLALGSQGGGKTEGVILAAILLALWYPGRTGGVVAPTRQRVKVVWRKFLKTLPPQWIRSVRPGDHEITLVTGSLIQFFAAKRQGKHTGSPLAGNDWYWAVEDEQQDIDDETLEEVDARGRINPGFQVFSSATNEAYGSFQRRLKEYQTNPSRRVVKFTGPDNSFIDPAHWENLRANWDPDTYRRKILCEDLPTDGRVYPAFEMGSNVKTRPPKSIIGREVDITPLVTKDRYQTAYRYVVGVDFGVRVCASVILQCFRAEGDITEHPRERQWWILDEIVTEGRTPDWHAAQVLEWFKGDVTQFIAITGQDSNSTNPDKSDFVMFRDQRINLMRASYSKRIMVHHRIAMVNALLHAADGRRRLFVDCDASGRVKAKKVIDSFEGLRLNAQDKPETYGKGTKGGEDLTHYTDALGYALFPFESFRGTPPPEADETSNIRKRLEKRWESNPS